MEESHLAAAEEKLRHNKSTLYHYIHGLYFADIELTTHELCERMRKQDARKLSGLGDEEGVIIL